MTRRAPHTFIGISGWRYTPWRGVFYPKDWPQKKELEFVASKMNSDEINGTFYSLQRPSSFAAWYDQTPAGFVFSVKGGRYITHMRRLREVRTPLANFFASGILRLRDKLGPILWQFPPNMGFDAEKFETFFSLLPRDTLAAAALAKEHDGKMKAKSWTRADRKRPIRHAVEIRHPQFMCEEFIAMLRRHRIALVFADTPKWPYTEDITADFIYLRLHGDKELYASGYGDEALDRWAQRIRAWRQGRQPRDAKRISRKLPPKAKVRDVYAYFDNDIKVHAPFDAMSLAAKLREGRPTSK